MKHFLFLLFLAFQTYQLSSQRAIRFVDSLTLETKRTWVNQEGLRFTNIGDDCSFGLEITFYEKNSKATVHECHEGEWKEYNYTFEVDTDRGDHRIIFYEQKKYLLFWKKKTEIVDFKIEPQIVTNNNGDYYTELNVYKINEKATILLKSE